MTEEQKSDIILQLQDVKGKNKVAKFNEGTQTYYSDEEEAKKKVPQPVIITAPKDTRSLNEVTDVLKKRLEDQKELKQTRKIGSTFPKQKESHWNSERK